MASRSAVAFGFVALLCTPALASEGAAQWAERLDTEKEQCQMLLQLCHQATDALDSAALAPRGRDVLASRNAGMANLRVEDAVSAARVFMRKNGGKRLSCFGAPDCRFLDGRL